MSTKNFSDFPAALNEPLIFELEKISPQIISSLVSVWYESVKATHSFLSESEIGRIMEYVPEAISSVEHLIVVSWGGTFVAFMGVTGRRLEMLFIHPDSVLPVPILTAPEGQTLKTPDKPLLPPTLLQFG